MKKGIAIFVMMVIAAIGLNAQNSYETKGKWEKTEGSCVAIKVSTSVDNAIKTLETMLRRDGLNGKKSGKTLKYEKTVFTAISTDYINLYVKAESANKDKKNPVTAVYVFISKGIVNDFVSSSNDKVLIDSLMSYLDQKYAAQIQENFVNAKIEAKNKEIDEISKSIANMEKTVNKKTEDVEKLEKQIEKAQKDITNNKKDIEKTKKDLETHRNLLKTKQKELNEIK